MIPEQRKFRSTHSHSRFSSLVPVFPLAALLLGACVTPEARNGQTARQQETASRVGPASTSSNTTIKPGSNAAENSNAAARHLRKQSEEAMGNLEYATAATLVERALRVAPYDAENYLLLAQIRLQQQRPTDALQLADKGLRLNSTAATLDKLRTVRQLAVSSQED